MEPDPGTGKTSDPAGLHSKQTGLGGPPPHPVAPPEQAPRWALAPPLQGSGAHSYALTPSSGLCASACRPDSSRPLQVEGEGPERLMDALHQADPAERRRGVAHAQRETEEEYARSTEQGMSK